MGVEKEEAGSGKEEEEGVCGESGENGFESLREKGGGVWVGGLVVMESKVGGVVEEDGPP